MSFNYLNLVMAGFWLFVAVVILGRDWFFPADRPTPLDGFPAWIGFVALGGVVYNVFRWRMASAASRHRQASPVNPLAVRRPHEENDEPLVKNPDFDFIKLPDAGPGPSVNGEYK